MHLLHVKTGKIDEFRGDPDQLEFKTFLGDDVPEYAILSHTWGSDEEEVSFKELRKAMKRTSKSSSDDEVLSVTGKAGFAKVRWTCEQALLDGYRYVWVDTCCIDKDSSSELSRAINSMFNWYRRSAICYAYLADVESTSVQAENADAFVTSRWFTRAWTLQELIAPKDVVFYGSDWRLLGHRNTDFITSISERTRVDPAVLKNPEDLLYVSAAAKMSWAAKRQATQKEDEAYSLLGLFGVNLPLLYGEGTSAFDRLQREIFRQTNDHSIFAWDYDDYQSSLSHSSLFSPSARLFTDSTDVKVSRLNSLTDPTEFANDRLRFTTPIFRHEEIGSPHDHLAPLRCEWKGRVVALKLHRSRTGDVDTFFIPVALRRRLALVEPGEVQTAKPKTIVVKQVERFPSSRYCPVLYLRLQQLDGWGNLLLDDAWPENLWDVSGWEVPPKYRSASPTFVAKFPTYEYSWSSAEFVLRDERSQRQVVIRFTNNRHDKVYFDVQAASFAGPIQPPKTSLTALGKRKDHGLGFRPSQDCELPWISDRKLFCRPRMQSMQQAIAVDESRELLMTIEDEFGLGVDDCVIKLVPGYTQGSTPLRFP